MHIKTHGEADTLLRFPFHTFGTGKPIITIVIGIYKRYLNAFMRNEYSIPCELNISLLRVDIGVIEEKYYNQFSKQ